MDIRFLPEIHEDIDKGVVTCWAVVEGRRIRCDVTKGALFQNHHGTGRIKPDFAAARKEVEKVLADKIRSRDGEPVGSLLYSEDGVIFESEAWAPQPSARLSMGLTVRLTGDEARKADEVMNAVSMPPNLGRLIFQPKMEGEPQLAVLLLNSGKQICRIKHSEFLSQSVHELANWITASLSHLGV